MIFRKNMYDVITRPPKYDVSWLIAPMLWCICPLICLAAFWIVRSHKRLMNGFIRHISSPIKHGLSALFAHLPVDFAEVLWLLAAIVAVVFLIRTVFLLVTGDHRLKRLIRRVLAVCSACLIVYCGYCFFWGANYYGDTFSDLSGISSRGCRTEELYELSVALADHCSALSGGVPRNADGITELSADALLSRSSQTFGRVQEEFPCLAGNVTDARAMLSSRLISYTGFTGFLFPFTGESLVNVDAPDCLIPSTALHELAHQCDVASEAECNFIAVIAGLHSGDTEYAYSSALLAYIHVSNALYQADKDLYADAKTHLNEQVLADITDNNDYWAAFHSPVETTSQKIYTGFLNSYGQSDGLASYGKCVDLLVTYYFDLHPDALEAGTL